jgi:tRNA(adenine34) deaminase
MHDDDYFMQRCSVLAERAVVNGNSAIGSVIVKDNQIISEGEEAVSSKKDITCHAEIEAIRLAVKQLNTTDLSGCILYSTHEPCIMCSYAIRYYKITKVIYRDEANSLGGISSSMPLLITNEVPPHWSNAPVIVHLKKK